MSSLGDLVGKDVMILTCDGRSILGVLRGFDQVLNVVLERCHERIFSTTQGVVQNVLGLYMIRGDNIAMISEIDEEKDALIDYSTIRADPIKQITH